MKTYKKLINFNFFILIKLFYIKKNILQKKELDFFYFLIFKLKVIF